MPQVQFILDTSSLESSPTTTLDILLPELKSQGWVLARNGLWESPLSAKHQIRGFTRNLLALGSRHA